MILIKYLFSGILLATQVQQCNTTNAVTDTETTASEKILVEIGNLQEIQLERMGGMLGLKEKLVITPVTTTYTYQLMRDEKAQVIEQNTDLAVWNELSKLYSKADFTQVEQEESRMLYDGIDDHFTLNKEFKIVNPTSENADILRFMELVENLRNELNLKLEK